MVVAPAAEAKMVVAAPVSPLHRRQADMREGDRPHRLIAGRYRGVQSVWGPQIRQHDPPCKAARHRQLETIPAPVAAHGQTSAQLIHEVNLPPGTRMRAAQAVTYPDDAGKDARTSQNSTETAKKTKQKRAFQHPINILKPITGWYGSRFQIPVVVDEHAAGRQAGGSDIPARMKRCDVSGFSPRVMTETATRSGAIAKDRPWAASS